jgi:hypothetical protein
MRGRGIPSFLEQVLEGIGLDEVGQRVEGCGPRLGGLGKGTGKAANAEGDCLWRGEARAESRW